MLTDFCLPWLSLTPLLGKSHCCPHLKMRKCREQRLGEVKIIFYPESHDPSCLLHTLGRHIRILSLSLLWYGIIDFYWRLPKHETQWCFPFYCACCFVGLPRAKKKNKTQNKTEAPTNYARTSRKTIHFHKMFGIPLSFSFKSSKLLPN